ncbi:MAG: hypothetical protein KDB27_20015 [Planctomycetales bacterium]|nr:hypothetical protein [Planctomycetales bacterium]
MSDDINVMALMKGDERYVFLFDDANRSQVLRTLGRYASSPDLSFSWYDAAVLSQKVRKGPGARSVETNRLFITETVDNYNDDTIDP